MCPMRGWVGPNQNQVRPFDGGNEYDAWIDVLKTCGQVPAFVHRPVADTCSLTCPRPLSTALPPQHNIVSLVNS